MRTKRVWPIAVFGAMLAVPAAADEVAGAQTSAAPEVETSAAAAEALFYDLRRSSEAETPDLMAERTIPSDYTISLADIEFRDGGVISRVSRIRQLSLLTFAEFGSARLFLGVNDDGLLGLHFGATPAYSADRHLELARMPYLEPRESAEEAAD